MISFGKNIVGAADPLSKVPVVNIYHALRNPKSETAAQIRQLRIIHSIDEKKYAVLKRQLPYIVCGIFNPPYRRGENFAYIEYFILDIDKVSEKGLEINTLRLEMQKDDRVLMCFVSPSEDGIKLMFKLSERCYDKGKYSVFYKLFAKQFARQYHIEQVIDNVTSDVTRACFVSMDPDAYYNSNAQCVNLSAYVSEEDPTAFFDLKREILLEEKKQKKVEQDQQIEGLSSNNAPPVPLKNDVDADVIANVKAILGLAAKRNVAKPPVYVPEQLNEIIDDLKRYIEQTGLLVTEIINISYAKKIRVKSQCRQAEVNLFYGKKGFSVVKSPRTGTDPELNEMLVQLINSFILK